MKSSKLKLIKIGGFLIIFFFGLLLGNIGFNPKETAFENLSSADMHSTIIKQRDYAIAQAVEASDYRCCIEPACTMCYMEANKWNNFTPSTCACDDFIARGEEPCPQCGRSLADIHDETNSSCDIADLTNPACSSSEDK
ncbi:MAG: hypothetical protein ABIG10_00390 [bacterium]